MELGYNFELDTFQKDALQALKDGSHVLCTAHTGSGKTLLAEFGIHLGGRVIYTSPIKSLSNQKFHDFTKKFPDKSVGIYTGDIQYQPNSTVLIMTTEILRNYLVNPDNNDDLDINMSEVRYIILDEVHYICNKDRGHVWEQVIMMCPKHVQLIMLSATVDNIKNFSNWVSKTTGRSCVITGTDKRVVPLEFKWLNKYCNRDYLLTSNAFSKLSNDMDGEVYDDYSINNVVNMLKEENKTPAIVFVFSKAKLEKLANIVNINLLDDSKQVNEVVNKFEKLLRQHPSYDFIKHNSQTEYLRILIKKGVGIHHAGMLPILKETMEILYLEKYLPILFTTETFSVGINMPTKTVILTSIRKYSDAQYRYLNHSEFMQISGRAGRRGIDSKGFIYIWSSPYKTNWIDIKEMVYGEPDKIKSNYKYNYMDLLMNIGEDVYNSSFYNYSITPDFNKFTIMENELKEYFESYPQHKRLVDNDYLTPVDLMELQKNNKLRDIKKSYIEYNLMNERIKAFKDNFKNIYKFYFDFLVKANLLDTNGILTTTGKKAIVLGEDINIIWAINVFDTIKFCNPHQIASIIGCLLSNDIKINNDFVINNNDIEIIKTCYKNAVNLESSFKINEICNEPEDYIIYNYIYNWSNNNILPEPSIILEGDFMKLIVRIARYSKNLIKYLVLSGRPEEAEIAGLVYNNLIKNEIQPMSLYIIRNGK